MYKWIGLSILWNVCTDMVDVFYINIFYAHEIDMHLFTDIGDYRVEWPSPLGYICLNKGRILMTLADHWYVQSLVYHWYTILIVFVGMEGIVWNISSAFEHTIDHRTEAQKRSSRRHTDSAPRNRTHCTFCGTCPQEHDNANCDYSRSEL